MLIPLSWLKEYVDIKIPFSELARKLSEVGLTVEVWKEEDNDIIFDPEVTPNRPDWLSVLGIAREIAAVTNTKLKFSEPRPASKPKKKLDIKLVDDFALVPHVASILISGVKVKPSPDWLLKKIKQIGLRPINNLVDITNYVLWLYGNPLHVFDYDKIRGHTMVTEQAKGGENFRSLDAIDYVLPKGAIIFKDLGRVIDLLPLKGGENTAASAQTTNILLHSVVCDPLITRKTSQALGLRSDSSAISERGVDPNGTVRAVLKSLELILDLAGGEVASELFDRKKEDFRPWTVELSHERLEKVLGINIDPKKVIEIFRNLTLEPSTASKQGATLYRVVVPTYRNDIHIEEDLIEEVGRLTGYNNFPKTLPASAVPTIKVPYFRDFDLEYQVKEILKGAGYAETYTYSLVSEKQLLDLGINPEKAIRVDNPVSRDYEYMRPHLLGNMLNALKLNLPNFPEIKLFELGKVYSGANLGKIDERLQLAAITNGSQFLQCKGTIELLLACVGVSAQFKPLTKDDNPNLWLHPGRGAGIFVGEKRIGMIAEVHPALLSGFGIKSRATEWTVRFDDLLSFVSLETLFKPVPKYPAIVEDLSLIIPAKVLFGEVVSLIGKTTHLIKNIELVDIHEESKTLRLTYQSANQNLTDTDVAKTKKEILASLKEKLKVQEKE